MLSAPPCHADDPLVLVQTIGSLGGGDGQLGGPHALCVAPSGEIFVANTGNTRVEIFSPGGDFLTHLDGYGTPFQRFVAPLGVAVGSDGTIYVSDDGNLAVFNADRSFQKLFQCQLGVLELDPTGQYIYGTAGTYMRKYRLSDGQLIGTWQFANWSAGPLGFAVGASGTIYVCGDAYVQKLSPDGAFLGHWEPQGGGAAVAVDANENVFVTMGNNEIGKYTKNGVQLSRTPTNDIGLVDIAVNGSGDNVLVLSGFNGHLLRYGSPSVAVSRRSWGQLKRRYR